MPSYYDKVIVREVDGEKRSVVIFDTKLHVPVIFELKKCGMEEVLDTLNQQNNEKALSKTNNILSTL